MNVWPAFVVYFGVPLLVNGLGLLFLKLFRVSDLDVLAISNMSYNVSLWQFWCGHCIWLPFLYGFTLKVLFIKSSVIINIVFNIFVLALVAIVFLFV